LVSYLVNTRGLTFSVNLNTQPINVLVLNVL